MKDDPALKKIEQIQYRVESLAKELDLLKSKLKYEEEFNKNLSLKIQAFEQDLLFLQEMNKS